MDAKADSKSDTLSLAESIARSMDCDHLELLPFLPYILEDFNEIGSSADFLLSVVERHAPPRDRLEVLDLGCGKGAVTIRVAECLPANCLGIDGMCHFVEHARKIALEKGLDACTFLCADVREAIGGVGRADVVILASIGPVFGDWFDTLSLLKEHVPHDGIVIVDEGYVADDETFHHGLLQKKADVYRQIGLAGMQVVREYVDQNEGCFAEYDRQMADMLKRCRELQHRHPQVRHLLEAFIGRQRAEYAGLKEHVIRATLILRRAGGR